MLRKTDVAALDSKRCERLIREKFAELGAIRHANGGTLDGVSGANARKARELGDELNLLGERLDEAGEVEGVDERFVKLSEYLTSPTPPGIRATGATSGGGGAGRGIAGSGSLYDALNRAGFDPVRNRRVNVLPGPAVSKTVTGRQGPSTVRIPPPPPSPETA